MSLDFGKSDESKAKAREEKDVAAAASTGVDDLSPKQVDATKLFSASGRDDVWLAVYKSNGLGSADEKRKRGMRYAYYVYALKNGTSGEGGWDGTAKMYDGTTIHAKYVKLAAPGELRRFFRATAPESYGYLSKARIVREDPDIIAMAQERMVPVRLAYAMADFLDIHTQMSDEEKKVNEANKNFSINRARASRAGKSVTDLHHEAEERKLDAQGPVVHGKSIDF
jgi:hypothetical protein